MDLYREAGYDFVAVTDHFRGHEIRAIQARIRAHFGGSPLRLIQWLDAQVDVGGQRDATAGTDR